MRNVTHLAATLLRDEGVMRAPKRVPCWGWGGGGGSNVSIAARGKDDSS
jgi:hypothetical protein